ncbi:MAG: cytochrome c1 [Pseudomonadota bacterium]
MHSNRILAAALAVALVPTGAAFAAGGSGYVENYSFSFDGPFGTFDEDQLRRGFQVYTEVCSGCHGLQYVPLRTLADEGGPNFTEEEVRAYIEQNFIEVYDDDIQDWRSATPNDHFPGSALENAPDLSLMAKARARGGRGADYIASLLTHYNGSEQEQAGVFLYGNDTYDGGYLAMSPPLDDGWVEFQDGAPNDLESMSMDVAAFLMWTAEPHMMARKRMAFTAILMLSVLSVLLYLTNKRIWAPVKAQVKGGTPAE